jgi:hypothetical protein
MLRNFMNNVSTHQLDLNIPMNHKWGYYYSKYSAGNQSKQKNTFASYLHNVGNIPHGSRLIESYHVIL